MKQVHLILQGKGGVGKSFIASLLQQHFIERDLSPIGIDTDPVNASFSGYKALKAERLQIIEGSRVNPRIFDNLIEKILEADDDSVFIIDNGASTFIPLCAYLFENHVVEYLKEEDCSVYFHTVLTGGQALADTMNGINDLFKHFEDVPVCIWINEYFGKPENNGKTFEQSKLYEENADQIHGLLKIAEVNKETFGFDMRQMMEAKLTFEEVKENTAFKTMARSRLHRVWKDLNEQIATMQF